MTSFFLNNSRKIVALNEYGLLLCQSFYANI